MLIKWLMSKNRKEIGILDFTLAVWSGMIGSSISFLIRVELSILGMFLNNDMLYNSLVTSHAFLMMLFTVMRFLIGGFSNWLIALMLSSPDVSFPRMYNISFWLLPPSLL